MTNSDIMMVHPGQIVIDMPVDEQNVMQKMESMRERGIIQPVTLWLQGMRVIDGFHRSVAAQRLGWSEIPCYVVDCNEDAFWDARIQSARQHHRIERERLTAWILESWKTTEWYAPTQIDPHLFQLYTSSDGEALSLTLSIIETLWTIYRKDGKPREWFEEVERKVGKRNPRIEVHKVRRQDDNSPHKVNAKLVEWIESKAQRWGIKGDEIVQRIFSAYPRLMLEYGILDHFAQSLDRLSRSQNLSFAERQSLASKIDVGERYFERGENYDFDEWAETQAKKPAHEQIKLSEYMKLKRESAEQQRETNLLMSIERERERARFLQTPQGQAESHKRNVQDVKDAMDRAIWAVKSIDRLLSDSQDFSAPIAETIATLTDFHNEHFKRKDTKLKDLLASRNAKLRKEVKTLTEKVASLERALNTKQTVTPRLKNVMVEHAQ